MKILFTLIKQGSFLLETLNIFHTLLLKSVQFKSIFTFATECLSCSHRVKTSFLEISSQISSDCTEWCDSKLITFSVLWLNLLKAAFPNIVSSDVPPLLIRWTSPLHHTVSTDKMASWVRQYFTAQAAVYLLPAHESIQDQPGSVDVRLFYPLGYEMEITSLRE